MKPYTLEIIEQYRALVKQIEEEARNHFNNANSYSYGISKDVIGNTIARLDTISSSLLKLDEKHRNCLLMLLNGDKPSEHIEELGFANSEQCSKCCQVVSDIIGKSSYLALYQAADSKKEWSIGAEADILMLPKNKFTNSVTLPDNDSTARQLYWCFERFTPASFLSIGSIDRFFKFSHLLFPLLPFSHSYIGVSPTQSLHSRWHHPERRDTCIKFYRAEEEKVEGETHNYWKTIFTSPRQGSADWCAWHIIDSLYEENATGSIYAEMKLRYGDETPQMDDIFKTILLTLNINSNNSFHLKKFGLKSVLDLKRLLF